MNSDRKNFGLYMKKCREAKKMTQKDLAEAIGVQIKSISSIERGLIYPSTDNLFHIARILDMSIDEFIFGATMYDPDLCIDDINALLKKMHPKYLPLFMGIVSKTASEIVRLGETEGTDIL